MDELVTFETADLVRELFNRYEHMAILAKNPSAARPGEEFGLRTMYKGSIVDLVGMTTYAKVEIEAKMGKEIIRRETE